MAKTYSTPGVYIEEKNAFPNSIAPLAIGVPVFIGFTEFAIRENQSLSGRLVRISSFDEFNRYFGGPPKTTYALDLSDSKAQIKNTNGTQYYLYYSLKLYFNNGGGDCYIYSAGAYTKDENPNAPSKMTSEIIVTALELLEKNIEPTIIVIPDGHTMDDASAYYGLFQLVLPHCRKMTNRFTILDVYGGGDSANLANSATTSNLLKELDDGVGTRDLCFGAAYWPWVQSTVVQANDLNYFNLEDLDPLRTIIIEEAKIKFPDVDGATDPNFNEIQQLANNLGNEQVIAEANLTPTSNSSPTLSAEMKAEIRTLIARQHNALLQVSETYKGIMKRIHEAANIMPPCGAMAGVYKATDSSVGTHQSPANISLISVIKPMVNLNAQEQETLNIPISGKAINAIRSFPGKGVLVWGARTMDGNSQEWRYISVRRTVSMIESSIKYAAKAFVFQPNNSSTWANLKTMITDFLTNLWHAGALAGATQEDSFGVEIGLGSTMTPTDILDGYMRVSVRIAVSRPAEFILITFEQQMQTP